MGASLLCMHQKISFSQIASVSVCIIAGFFTIFTHKIAAV